MRSSIFGAMVAVMTLGLVATANAEIHPGDAGEVVEYSIYEIGPAPLRLETYRGSMFLDTDAKYSRWEWVNWGVTFKLVYADTLASDPSPNTGTKYEAFANPSWSSASDCSGASGHHEIRAGSHTGTLKGAIYKIGGGMTIMAMPGHTGGTLFSNNEDTVWFEYVGSAPNQSTYGDDTIDYLTH